MKASSILGHCAQLLKIVWKSPQPADQITSEYMRGRKYIGSKERRAISEIVFYTLRVYGTTEYVAYRAAEQLSLPSVLGKEYGIIASALLLLPSLYPSTIPTLLGIASGNSGDDNLCFTACCEMLTEKAEYSPAQAKEFCHTVLSLWQHLVQESDTLRPISLQGCLPDWITQRWYQTSGNNKEETLSLARSLLGSAPLTARVNTRMMSREEAMNVLEKDGIATEPTSFSPQGIVFAHRLQLTQHELYRSGVIEVQDEGSQLVGFALAPAENWNILDACAGAGGKSLHLAVLQNNKGKILASDAEPARLREAYFRSQKAGLSSIRAQALRTLPASEQQRLPETFDAVLIDAPCTGMGTVRRMPLVKWRLTPELLERTNRKQQKIITEYARYVRKGGVLLYGTCSLMKEENEDIVQDFLRRHPEFQPEPLAPAFASYGIHLPGVGADDWYCTLKPHIHHTDGFFIARMKKK